jgi:hypothetical protein
MLNRPLERVAVLAPMPGLARKAQARRAELDFVAALRLGVINFDLQHREATLEFFGALTRPIFGFEFRLQMSINDENIAGGWQFGRPMHG